VRLEQWVEKWLAQLRQRNVLLVFVADPPQCFGGSDHRKGYTLMDRAMQKVDKVKQLATTLIETPATTEAELPANDQTLADTNVQATSQLLLATNGCFPFAREKLRGVLKKHGIPITTATREADEELGELVRSNRAYAVLAEDSDFFCMKNVRYIPMAKFAVTEEKNDADLAAKVTITARVFTPELVATSLGIEVDQLVDLALVCGNDLTPLLDNEFAMATDLSFPIQRAQRTGSISPKAAAQWILTQMPILENPVLPQIEAKRPGFLAALHEVYRFYGHSVAFGKKFRDVEATSSALPKKKLKTYKALLDRYEYPPSAIDVMESGMRGLNNKLDPIAIAGRKSGVTMTALLAPIRYLAYHALGMLKVDEFEAGGTIVHTVQLKQHKFMEPMVSVPMHSRKNKQVDEMHRKLVFSVLYATEGERKRATQLCGSLGKPAKKGAALRTVVYSLLLLWKQDRTCLGDACLLGPRSLDVFLLTSFILVQFDLSKKKNRGLRRPLPRVDEQSIDWEVFASSAAFVEMLKLVHQLRIVLGDKSPQNMGCPTLFSAEVFLHVCAALSSCTPDGQKPGKRSSLTRADVVAAAEQFLGESFNRNSVWQDFCQVRAAMYQMKKCSGQLSDLEENVRRPGNGQAVRGLEKILMEKTVVIESTGAPPSEGRAGVAIAVESTTKTEMRQTGVAVLAAPSGVDSEVSSTLSRSAAVDARQFVPKLSPTPVPPSGGRSELPRTPGVPLFVPPLPLFVPPLPPPLPANGLLGPDDLVPPPIITSPDVAFVNGGSLSVSSQPPVHVSPRVVRGLTPTSVAKKSRAKRGKIGAVGVEQPPLPPLPPMPPMPPVEADNAPREPPSLSGLMETLPVFAHREEILQNVAANQLTIIQGETGCGKSTSVPQFLHDDWARNPSQYDRPVNIYVTQPRRIAAIELAHTVARMRKGNEFDEDGELGKVIGYRIGQKQCISSKTKITYVTTGYMVERLIHDSDALASMTHLVLDEVHERSMDVDLLLLLLRLQLSQHSHLRLVIMSATMDAKVLIKYLGSALSTRLIKKKPLFVGSKLFPVENVLLDDVMYRFPRMSMRARQDVAQMMGEFDKLYQLGVSARSELAAKAIAKIHEKQLSVIVEMVRLLIENSRYQDASQCILIFVPGINAINSLFEELTLLTNVMGVSDSAPILVLHSGIELENQQKAFETLGRRTTKIVLSTNIAESSVTIPDVTHVINCAIEKQIEMPNAGSTHAEVLVDTWCSRASVIQRSGRAGRVMPGTAFHLVTEGFKNGCMAEYTTPEILRKPLDRIILQLKGKLNHFGLPSALLEKALDAPDLSHIDGAYKLLADFDAINSSIEKDAQLTKFGSFVCHLPLNLQLCRLLMTACSLSDDTNGAEDVAVESKVSAGRSSSFLLNMVILVATLSVPDLFVMPSFFHSRSAIAFMNEMKANLKAKLALDGDLWSEPLALWRFYITTMTEQPLNRKRHLGSMLQKVAISFRRYQTLNFLISDLCSRLISLSKDRLGEFEGLLDGKAVNMLRRLDAYASSQVIDKELQAFAKRTVASSKQKENVLRFLLIQNYGDQVICGALTTPKEFPDDDMQGNDRVDLRVDKEFDRSFAALSNAQKMALFGQMASSNTPLDEFAALAYDKRLVSLYSYQTPLDGAPPPNSTVVLETPKAKKKSKKKKSAKSSSTASVASADSRSSELAAAELGRMSFPVSLAYFVRGEKFPVVLGLRENTMEQESVFKFRVADSSANSSNWLQQKDNAKVSIGNRSLFSLPVRAGQDCSKLLAVYADRLFTGDESRMFCSKCTLLPPDNVGYYPIVMLVSAPRRANIWLHMDSNAGEILTVKVDGQVVVFPPKSAMRVEALSRINAIRKALSSALEGEAGGGLRVSDVLALADETTTVTKASKAKSRRYEWRQLTMKEPEQDASGDATSRQFLPELELI
jgi:HrpA-like RNA helicase